MLDIKFIRENQEMVKKAIADKNCNPEILPEVISLDDTRRSLIVQTEALRSRRNELNDKLKQGLKQRKDEKLMAESKQLKARLGKLELELKEVEDRWVEALYQIPNIPWEDVPVGKDETENQVVAEWGKRPKLNFEIRDHVALGKDLDIIDIARAAKVAGARFGYWKGAAAQLALALINYAFKVLTSEKILKKIADSVEDGYNPKPFVPVFPPVMIRPEVYQRTARLSESNKDEKFYLEKDNLYLIGSAEHTLVSMHMDETIPVEQLPLRYVGFSTSFRREAGSYGKDTKGMIRVHQFDKVEMESFTTPENGMKEHLFLVAIEEYILQSLELPYQKLLKCTADIGDPNARGVDLNAWMAGQNQYRETHTADFMTDYQARRLNTKLRQKDGTTLFVHNNDATVITMRALIAILENNQQKDGSISVPKVLQEYTGFDVIKQA